MKLFLSYSRDDKAWVYELWRALRDEAQHDAWIDRRLVPAQDWWGTILDNIEACECFIYVMTPLSVASIYCRAELEYALALNKPVLPLMLKPCDYPPSLSQRRVQYQVISDDMHMDRVLFRTGQGLTEIRIGLIQGKYTPPTPPPPRPALPTPASEPEQVSEVFALAEEAAAENNIPLAEKLFQQVMDADPQGWGVEAAERLTEIRWERDRGRDYLAVVRMAGNPATVRGARAAASAYVRKYGWDYDPKGVLPGLLASTTPGAPNWDRAELHRVLDARLSLDELRQAVFDLGLDYDNLAGETKAAKARALITRLEQRGQLDRLVVWIKANRNDIDTRVVRPGLVGEAPETVKPAPTLPPQAPPAAPKPARPALGDRMTDPDGVTMVYVPAGKFMMGSTKYDDEKPPHSVTIAQGFWLDLTPVTNAMYARFVKAGGYQKRDLWTPGGWQWVQANKKAGPNDYKGFTQPDQPRVGMTWFEAYAYCRWRSGRLPAEAEWEWAARGPENREYPWGKDFDPRRVIYRPNSGDKTAVVNAETRLEGASWVGALDMSGNVWEWVSSLYKPYPYEAKDGRESLEDDKEARVLRGGSWDYVFEYFLRAAYRFRNFPTSVYGDLGFRCARSS
ncbi:MAG: SUMF1/EgtB/PvdO family nonheme iron enzyme [Anaerolineae bacterium]|nr:SUMF1/EgtB/PvdO family nonheme iron enzyme [Anaerolineae bacterium]